MKKSKLRTGSILHNKNYAKLANHVQKIASSIESTEKKLNNIRSNLHKKVETLKVPEVLNDLKNLSEEHASLGDNIDEDSLDEEGIPSSGDKKKGRPPQIRTDIIMTTKTGNSSNQDPGEYGAGLGPKEGSRNKTIEKRLNINELVDSWPKRMDQLSTKEVDFSKRLKKIQAILQSPNKTQINITNLKNPISDKVLKSIESLEYLINPISLFENQIDRQIRELEGVIEHKEPPQSSYKVVLNSIGREVLMKKKDSIVLDKYPFHLTRCDQIVKFEAKFITDMNEYRTREDGFFTITAYYVNLFKNVVGNELLRSILMPEVKEEPHHLRGAKPCILVNSPSFGDKDITICMETKEAEDNIKAVLDYFHNCRTNDLIAKPSNENCLKKHIGKNWLKVMGDMRRQVKKYDLRNEGKYFHPGSDDVPGIKQRQSTDDLLRQEQIKEGFVTVDLESERENAGIGDSSSQY